MDTVTFDDARCPVCRGGRVARVEGEAAVVELQTELSGGGASVSVGVVSEAAMVLVGRVRTYRGRGVLKPQRPASPLARGAPNTSSDVERVITSVGVNTTGGDERNTIESAGR
jgi:hypothetical protein